MKNKDKEITVMGKKGFYGLFHKLETSSIYQVNNRM